MNADLVSRILKIAPPPGDIVEFGVFQGRSLRLLSDAFPDRNIFGFDTFAGIPSSSVPVVHAGSGWVGGFTDTSVVRVHDLVPRARLIAGRFEDLKALNEYGVERLAVAHIDADIYEGYRDAFRLITPYLQLGSVVVMDDLKPVPRAGFEDTWRHPWKAFVEWQASCDVPLLPVWSVDTSWMWVVADDEYAQRPIFDSLTRPSIEGSARNIAHHLMAWLRRKGHGERYGDD